MSSESTLNMLQILLRAGATRWTDMVYKMDTRYKIEVNSAGLQDRNMDTTKALVTRINYESWGAENIKCATSSTVFSLLSS